VFRFGVNFFSLLSLTPVKWRITVFRDFSRFFQFPIITDTCIYLCNSLLFLPSLNFFSNSNLKMDTVACERRCGDRPPSICVMGGYISGKYGETRNSLSLSSEKRNGSRHLVFWSLGTLTGLRDWVRGLVA